jgi:hypothetical protein
LLLQEMNPKETKPISIAAIPKFLILFRTSSGNGRRLLRRRYSNPHSAETI